MLDEYLSQLVKKAAQEVIDKNKANGTLVGAYQAQQIAIDEIEKTYVPNIKQLSSMIRTAVRDYMSAHIDKVVRHEVKKEEIRDMVKDALNNTYPFCMDVLKDRAVECNAPSNAPCHGFYWSPIEDKKLETALNNFINNTAGNHSRTSSAIRHRIIDKDLL